MEIRPTYEILKAIESKKSETIDTSTDNKFGAILDEAIANTINSDTETGKAAMVDRISEIQFHPSLSSNENSIVEQTENLLDTLDNYQEILEDLSAEIENLRPFVSDMEMKREGLTSALNSLPDDDELKDILNEAMITSSLEIAKFNRGDYGIDDG